MSLYFTADTHFNHRAMVENGWRPQFTSVPEMNEALITGWNETVQPDDHVIHLGDFAMGAPINFLPIVAQLNGTKHLVPGNHDAVWPGHRMSYTHQKMWLDAGFASIEAFSRRRLGSTQLLSSHFPYVGDHQEVDRYSQYRLPDMGLWLLHGHVHHAWKQNGRMINVGVDVWDYKPVPFDQIIQIILSDQKEPE